MSKKDFNNFPKLDFIYAYSNNKIKKVEVLDQTVLNKTVLILLLKDSGIIPFYGKNNSIKADVVYSLNCKTLISLLNSKNHDTYNNKLSKIEKVKNEIKNLQKTLRIEKKELVKLENFKQEEIDTWIEEDKQRLKEYYVKPV